MHADANLKLELIQKANQKSMKSLIKTLIINKSNHFMIKKFSYKMPRLNKIDSYFDLARQSKVEIQLFHIEFYFVFNIFNPLIGEPIE